MSSYNDLQSNEEQLLKIRNYYKNLENELKVTQPISSKAQAESYLTQLNKLMKYKSDNISEIGNLKQLLHDQLTVGSDSQYSEKLHFLYELIQNVDDCRYEDSSNCNLVVSFDDINNTITLEYNEIGFTTENVFAISSIADSSKNKNGDAMQIGEKGIGFKSVFGIAKKVLIQSGYFSFSFYTDDFIIPIPEYDNFNYINGTKLTLYLMENESKVLFKEILDRYDHGKNIGEYLNDNPVIFLNNLTKISYRNKEKYISFGVSRKALDAKDFIIEQDVKISIEKNTSNKVEKFNLDCYRFTKHIIYNEQQCKSRYPHSDFKEKKHKIIAIALKDHHFKGSVYSFLPTKVKTNIPIIFHIPFKLKASREDIDDQGNNAWFTKTHAELITFIEIMYEQLSKLCPEMILNYIPTKADRNIFRSPNLSSNVFNRKEFILRPSSDLVTGNGKYIYEHKIIKGIDNKYHALKDMVFSNDLDLNIAQKILDLLNKNTFIIPNPSNITLSNYGIKEEKNLLNELSNFYLESSNNYDSIMKLFDNVNLETIKNNINIFSSKKTSASKHLFISTKKLKHIFQYNNYKQVLMLECFNSNLKSKLMIEDNSNIESCVLNDPKEDFIYQSIKSYAGKESFGFINDLANHDFKRVSFLKKNDFLLVSNTYLYSDIIESVFHFFDVCQKKLRLNNQENMGMSFIRIEGDTYNFKNDIKNNTDDPKTFINEINKRNTHAKIALSTTYDKLLRIIDNASISGDIYINELLQNANDVQYPDNVKPTFNLVLRNNQLIASYNECGFSKEDIRAITDIGESTKIHVVESYGGNNPIGEKGIGFKSVFKIAKFVEIHSRDYHFSLSKSAPTIPEWIPNQKYQDGTKIILHLEKSIKSQFKADELIEKILGLRNIEEFNIFGKKINVEKIKNQRNYIIDNKKYEYYIFNFTDNVAEDALNERRKTKPNEQEIQNIEVMFPKNITNYTKGIIYCGLPTTKETNYPFSINANFELNTSREGIVHNDWNNELVCIASLAILNSYDFLKQHIGLDVLKYITTELVIEDNYFSTAYNSLEKRLANKKLLLNINNEWIPLREAVVVDELKIDVLEAYDEEVDDNYVLSSTIEKYNKKTTLKKLGVEFYTDKELVEDLIEEWRIYEDLLIYNTEIRDKFFNFIRNYPNKFELFDYFYNYELVPVIFSHDEVRFIDINDDLYYSDNKKSPIYSEERLYYILDTDYLDLKTYDAIIEDNQEWRLQNFGNEEFEKYQGERIKKWLNDIDNLQERAEKVLNEFNQNRDVMIRAFDSFDYTTKSKIVFKLQNGNYHENTIVLYRYKHTDTLFDCALVADEYSELAEQLGIDYFLNCCEANKYPFTSISSDEHIECLFTFDFVYKDHLFYSLLENEKFDEEILQNYLLDIISHAGGYLNTDVLKELEIDDVNVCLNDDLSIVQSISLECPYITFEIVDDYEEDGDIDEFKNILEEIVYDIESSTKIGQNVKDNIKSWICYDAIYKSNMKRNFAIRTSDGNKLYLGNSIKTDKQVYDFIAELLANHFSYKLSFNKTMNKYNRQLMKRIGNNKYTLSDALEVSHDINTDFNNIEDEKRLLCEPYEHKEIVYGGYAKRCPCCGARVHTELTGFRIAKLRQTYSLGNDENNNILVDVPCCQNCFDAFSYADEYTIYIDSLIYDNKIDITVKLANEIWKPNVFTPRLAHKALIIAMNYDLYMYFYSLDNEYEH